MDLKGSKLRLRGVLGNAPRLPGEIDWLAFLPSGDLVVGAKGTRVLDPRTLVEKRAFEDVDLEDESLAGSVGGDLVLTSSGSELKLWDAATGKARAIVGHDRGNEPSVALSPDGRFVLAGNGDASTLKLWDRTVNAPEARLSGPSPRCALAFGANGIALSGGSSLVVWDAKSASAIATFDDVGDVSSVAISGDGKLAAFGGSKAGLVELDAKKLSPLDGKTSVVAFSGSTLVTGDASGNVRVGDKSAALHAGEVIALAVSKDGLVASATRTSIVVTGPDLVPLLETKGHRAAVSSLAFSKKGKLVSGGEDATVRLWDATSLVEESTWKAPGELLAVGFSQDAVLAADGGEWLARLEGRSEKTFPAKSASAVAFSEDGKRAVLASSSATVIDLSTGAVESTFELGARAMAVAIRGERIAVGADPHVSVFTIAGKRLTRFSTLAESVFGLAFSPDGREVHAACSDHLLAGPTEAGWLSSLLGSVARERATLELGAAVACFPDGRVVAVDDAGRIVIDSSEEGKLGETPTALAASPDGKTLALGTLSGRIALVEVVGG